MKVCIANVNKNAIVYIKSLNFKTKNENKSDESVK